MDRYAGFYALFAVMAFIALIVSRSFNDEGEFTVGRGYEISEPSVVSGSGQGSTVLVEASPGGSFLTQITVDGAEVDVLIDTGASYLTLRESDAWEAGITPDPGDYKSRFSTANGSVMAARAKVELLEFGPGWIENVTVYVLPDDKLEISLLGMNVLRRFGSVSFDRDGLAISFE